MLKPSTCLVDADLLCYLSSDPEEPAEYVMRSVRMILEEVQEGTRCDTMRVFLSSPENFRYKVDPDYKISRKDVEKPKHYQTTKIYLKHYWYAETAEKGYEADDYIAQIMEEEGDNVCVCSNDKDFLTVPGWHYKFNYHGAHELFYVTEEDAEAFLCYQLLVGDKADSIVSPLKTVKKNGEYSKLGYGHVAARDFLLQYDYSEMREAVRELYAEQGHEDRFDINLQLLAIGKTVL